MLTLIWLKLLIFVGTQTILPMRAATISIPPAFSYEHKSTLSTNPTIPEIIRAIAKYEIDSHIEVVLVGSIFTDKLADNLTKSLEVLSTISARHSPFRWIHEKLVYHISLGKTLDREISTASKDAGGTVEPKTIERILGDYHLRASTFTTLFVLHDVEGSIGRNYSTVFHYCSRRSFISPSGFAWFDMSAHADDIYPTTVQDSILPVPKFKGVISSSNEINLHELATIIHRSGEALVPVPFIRKSLTYSFPSLNNLNQLVYNGGRSHNTVNVVLFTLCADFHNVGLRCKPDSKAGTVLDEIITLYSTPFLRLSRTEITYSLHEEPQLLHAIHSATKYMPANGKVFMLSSAELLFWLGSCSLIKDVLSSLGSSAMYNEEITLIPVFAFQFPSTMEVFVDEYKQTVLAPFPEPPGGWGVSKIAKNEATLEAAEVAARLQWPGQAVITINHIKQPQSSSPGPALEYAPSSVSTGLECAGFGIPAGGSYSSEQLWNSLREAMWGISPTHVHYSSAAQQFVQDYFWYAPTIMRVKETRNNEWSPELALKMGESFREKRAVFRHTLFHRAEFVLNRYVEAIKAASELVPPVNITDLLDLMDDPNLSTATAGTSRDVKSVGKLFDLNGKNTNSVASGSKKSSKNKQDQPGLLEGFLKAMDSLSADVAHLEYLSANSHLNTAELKVVLLEDRIKRIIRSRTGTVECNGDADSKRSYSSSGFSFSGTRNWLVIVAVLVGGVGGYISAAKDKLKL